MKIVAHTATCFKFKFIEVLKEYGMTSESCSRL